MLTAALLCLISLGASAEQFDQTPLPYSYESLEPVIVEKTMRIHFERHHRAYINNLNAEVSGETALKGKTLEYVMSNVSRFNEQVRNHGGGHNNHELFWQVMAPVGEGGEPSEALRLAIEEPFGSMEGLKSEFNRAAASKFGSGWAWIIVDEDGHLKVTSASNQDNPLMDVVEKQGTPVLALDVWEHAYYLQYQSRRGDYTSAWWDVVNWHRVSELYADATQQ